MAGFILNYEFKDNSVIQVDGDILKYWEDHGLPSFEGDFEGFAKCYPVHIKELLDNRIITRT